MATATLTREAVQAAALRLSLQKRHGTLRVPDFWTSQANSKILTQAGPLPFVPFPWQRALVDGLTRRELILKSRDVGSSEICVRYLTWCLLKHGGNVLIKADKHDNACNLVRMARQYLTSLPDGERPRLTKDNETELEVAGRGTIRALARGGGRSERCRYLLLTERAFWEDSASELAEVSGALVADGWQIAESTANGFNEFHDLWVDELNGYRRTFVGRLDNPTHTLAWEAEKRVELAATPSAFDQEYPATATEAFVASGATLFDVPAILASRARYMREPLSVERVSVGGLGVLKVWTKPVPGRRYVAGADVAEGKDAGNQRLDYSGVAVYDAESCEHVADLHGQWSLKAFAWYAAVLCRDYNRALLGVERNNHGHAVLLELQNLAYEPLYRHTDQTSLKAGVAARAELGWPSTTVTKPILEQELGSLIAAQALRSPDQLFWDEVLSYVTLPGGRTGGQAGTHDDRVIMHAIAVQMRRQHAPLYRGSVPLVAPSRSGEPVVHRYWRERREREAAGRRQEEVRFGRRL